MTFLINPEDSDGAKLSRIKITQTGWSYQLHGIGFETSKLNSVISKKPDNTDWGFCTVKHYKLVSGVETLMSSPTQAELDTDCIRTDLHWEPTFDYEILGGDLKQLELPATDVYFWCVGVPQVSEGSGGSKCFVSGVNLRFQGLEEGVQLDGRAPKYMTYSASNHTNEFQFIFRHNAGVKHKVEIDIKLFKA